MKYKKVRLLLANLAAAAIVSSAGVMAEELTEVEIVAEAPVETEAAVTVVPETEPPAPVQPETQAPVPETSAPETEVPAPPSTETEVSLPQETVPETEAVSEPATEEQVKTEDDTEAVSAETEAGIEVSAEEESALSPEGSAQSEEESVTEAVSEETETESESDLPNQPETEMNAEKEPEAETTVTSSRADESTYAHAVLVYAVPHGPVDVSENERIAYQYLREDLGLNHAAACGVLANIKHESNFDTYAIGDSGTSYGLCQWHNERYLSLVSVCGNRGFDYNTIEGQLDYLKHELEGTYSGVYEHIRNVPDTKDGAYDAAHYFCVYFESPRDTYARAAERGVQAQDYYVSDFSDNDSVKISGDQSRISDVMNRIYKEKTAKNLVLNVRTGLSGLMGL